MGETVESYRMALESEISRWSGFARALRKEDRESFEELMDMSRNSTMAAGVFCSSIFSAWLRFDMVGKALARLPYPPLRHEPASLPWSSSISRIL